MAFSIVAASAGDERRRPEGAADLGLVRSWSPRIRAATGLPSARKTSSLADVVSSTLRKSQTSWIVRLLGVATGWYGGAPTGSGSAAVVGRSPISARSWLAA